MSGLALVGLLLVVAALAFLAGAALGHHTAHSDRDRQRDALDAQREARTRASRQVGRF